MNAEARMNAITTAREAISRAMGGAIDTWTMGRAAESPDVRSAIDDLVHELCKDLRLAEGSIEDLLEGEITGDGPTLESVKKGGGRRG
jgi:hypothetical protein